MADTERARAAIRFAYRKHRDVMGGLSMAQLKLEAAGGLLTDDLAEMGLTPDDPRWTEHATDGLEQAMTASLALQDAIRAAQAEVAALGGGSRPASAVPAQDATGGGDRYGQRPR